jgi:hypothetical protein
VETCEGSDFVIVSKISRFPIALICLLGLALFAVGSLMLLRFGVPVESLVEPAQQQSAEALREGASARTILGVYLFAIALGAGLTCAGLSLLLARLRG